jgi:DNA-binding transcriptional regulator YiaG
MERKAKSPERAPATPRAPKLATMTLVKAVRSRLGLTQAELGRLVGVHEITVCRWERGHLAPWGWHREVLEHLREASPPSNLRQLLKAEGGVCALALLVASRTPSKAATASAPPLSPPPRTSLSPPPHWFSLLEVDDAPTPPPRRASRARGRS